MEVELGKRENKLSRLRISCAQLPGKNKNTLCLFTPVQKRSKNPVLAAVPNPDSEKREQLGWGLNLDKKEIKKDDPSQPKDTLSFLLFLD